MSPVLVIGGTRGTGLLIAHLLLKRGHAVRVLARDPSEAASRVGPGIEIVAGDITKAETLTPAVRGSAHIILTAGVPSGRMAPESLVKLTDYQGVLNTLTAARATGFAGRFVYLNTIGIMRASLTGWLLNRMKRNALVWRRRVEEDIRASGIDYAIIRVGLLTDDPAGTRAIDVGQRNLPLAPWYRIARADVAEVFVAAMTHPAASRTTFDIVWGRGRVRESWDVLFNRLKPDGIRTTS
jgi:uncharacterized protein YbjT (DUF2867 family)